MPKRLDPEFLIECVNKAQRDDVMRGGSRDFTFEDKLEEQLEILKELVDKAKPEEDSNFVDGWVKCTKCEEPIKHKHRNELMFDPGPMMCRDCEKKFLLCPKCNEPISDERGRTSTFCIAGCKTGNRAWFKNC